jgi:hypothetical protein
MAPNTDMRLQFTIATVQLQPAELTEADLKMPADEFVRFNHYNDRAREGKMYVHKVDAREEFKDGNGSRGLIQSAVFDLDKSNGKQELKELMDALKETALERLYEARSDSKIIA